MPGIGRYAVTFRRGDGSEQTAVAQLDHGDVQLAEASLPHGWTRTGEAFGAIIDALNAMERSRTASSPATATLRDVDGGWDVGLGNVVPGDGGAPRCIAHGAMVGEPATPVWTCPECGARALYG